MKQMTAGMSEFVLASSFTELDGDLGILGAGPADIPAVLVP